MIIDAIAQNACLAAQGFGVDKRRWRRMQFGISIQGAKLIYDQDRIRPWSSGRLERVRVNFELTTGGQNIVARLDRLAKVPLRTLAVIPVYTLQCFQPCRFLKKLAPHRRSCGSTFRELERRGWGFEDRSPWSV